MDGEPTRCLAGGDDGRCASCSGGAPILAVRLRAVLPPSDVGNVLQETFLEGRGSYRPQDPGGTSKVSIAEDVLEFTGIGLLFSLVTGGLQTGPLGS